MLNELASINDKLLKMALLISKDDNLSNDLLQDTYLKLYDSGKDFESINFAYIYFTMRSIFCNYKKQSTLKNREILIDDFSSFESIEDNNITEKQINTFHLNKFEKLLIDAMFGRNITNSDNQIIKQIKGTSMLELSNKTGIHYNTIYKTWQKIKTKIQIED